MMYVYWIMKVYLITW